MVRAADCQCQSRNSPGFDPSILQHSGILRMGDQAVLNKELKKLKFVDLPVMLFLWSLLLCFHSLRLPLQFLARKKEKNKFKSILFGHICQRQCRLLYYIEPLDPIYRSVINCYAVKCQKWQAEAICAEGKIKWKNEINVLNLSVVDPHWS